MFLIPGNYPSIFFKNRKILFTAVPGYMQSGRGFRKDAPGKGVSGPEL
jgi:hypothetical protein